MSIHLFEQYPSSPGLQSELRPPPDHVADHDDADTDADHDDADTDADHDDADHDADGDEALPQPSPQEASTRHHKQLPNFEI